MNIQPKIFISYSHKNKQAQRFLDVFQLAIENHKYTRTDQQPKFEVWTDEKLMGGQIWAKEIDRALTESFAVLVAVTPEAMESLYVTYEWSFAIGLQRVIIPVIIEGDAKTGLHEKLHEKLKETQWINIAEKKDWKAECQNIIKNLETSYQELRLRQKNQEGERIAQLVYSALDFAKSQRNAGDLNNAMQSLQGALDSVYQFEQVYGTLSETSSTLADVIDDIYYEIGRTFFLMNDYQQAHDNFKKALEVNPEHVYCLLDLGIIARERADEVYEYNDTTTFVEQLKTALKYFEDASDLQSELYDHNGQSVWASIGGIHKRQGHLKEAKENYIKATDHKKSSYPYINLSLIFLALGDVPEMVVNARIAFYFADAQLRLKPDDRWAHADKLVAQIFLNPCKHEGEMMESEKMQRFIEHVLRVSPATTLSRLKSILEELQQLNKEHRDCDAKHKDVVDLWSIDYTMQKLKAI